ncbi:MAG TPA: DNA topoisomerase IB [Propionibacteriaceae bacterium]|nr:DNA topoisomerase IB [Propionibacteriaceae bacterium]
MPRLRRVTASSAWWHRRRAGRGFSYTDSEGNPLGPLDVERIRGLVIPPAWRDVRICPYPNGHLQAIGIDAAGRRQYLYHPAWRIKRDTEKFARIVEAAALLPAVRREVAQHLELDGMPVERALALAFRLLDLGAFRIGSDAYADQNGSFGLTTLERRHVRRRGDDIVFSFVGKSGVSHLITISDPQAVAALEVMRRRRDGGTGLLAYRRRVGWSELTAGMVNEYLGELFGTGFTAKDFRTWNATVMAAESLALSEEPGRTAASRKRAVKEAATQVSEYLGNTVAVAKSAYIDPRVVDLYESGVTIEQAARRAYRSTEERREAMEVAVRELLSP